MMLHIVKALQKLKWSIRTKLSFAFAVVLICFIFNGLISVWLLFNIKATEEKQTNTALYLDQSQRFEFDFNSQLNLYQDTIFVFINHPSSMRDRFRSDIVAYLSSDAGSQDDAQKTFITDFAQSYNVAFDHFSELEKLIDARDLKQAAAKWQEYWPDFQKTTLILEKRHQQLETARANGNQLIVNTVFLSTGLIISLMLLSLILTVLLLLLLERVLVQPLKKLQQALSLVAQGELDHHLEIVNRDEIGQLAQSFSAASRTLKQVVQGVQIVENLRAMTEQLANVSQQQTAGSTEQVTAITQVMAAMQESSHTAGQIAQRANQIAQLATTTREQVESVVQASRTSQTQVFQMRAVVETTLNGIERVGAQILEFSKSLSDLNAQSQAINKIVVMLGEIAGAVHLLALNASIEAASAGVYGERFKVVAREIKSLANRANQITVEAGNLIQSVQTGSNRTLVEVENGQAEIWKVIKANDGLRHNFQTLGQSAEETGLAVSTLLGLAGNVKQQAEEIKLVTQQQYISSEQVILSANSVGAVAKQNASTSHQIATNSFELESLTNQLNLVLSQVKLG